MQERTKPFFAALGVTLAALIFLLGCVTVDYQGRRLSLGDSTPPVSAVALPGDRRGVRVKALGVDCTLDLTPVFQAWDLLWDFACLPRDSAASDKKDGPTSGIVKNCVYNLF